MLSRKDIIVQFQPTTASHLVAKFAVLFPRSLFMSLIHISKIKLFVVFKKVFCFFREMITFALSCR